MFDFSSNFRALSDPFQTHTTHNTTMNIFLFKLQLMFDPHCVKMILETAQLLYSVWYVNNEGELPEHPDGLVAYRKTHANHPSAVWARSAPSHYKFLCRYGMALCAEYTFRYKKVHKCQQHIEWLQKLGFPFPKDGKLYIEAPPPCVTKYATEGCPSNCKWFALAMPEKYITNNARKSYERYYLSKAHGDENERMKKRASNKRIASVMEEGKKKQALVDSMDRKVKRYRKRFPIPSLVY